MPQMKSPIVLSAIELRPQDFNAEQGRHELRLKLAIPLRNIFIGLNAVVFVALVVLVFAEWDRPSADKLVTTDVIITMIGATTVQLGALMLTVMRGLFRE